MLCQDRVRFSAIVFVVHIVQALSFAFGPQKEVHADSAQIDGFFAKAGRLFSKFKQSDKHSSYTDGAAKLESVLPTQLRSTEIKQRPKRWVSIARGAPVTHKNARTVSHGVSDIETGQFDHVLEHSYLESSPSNRISGLDTGQSDLGHLNALLNRNRAADKPQEKDIGSASATMSFKIEITPNAAEITVSIGPTQQASKENEVNENVGVTVSAPDIDVHLIQSEISDTGEVETTWQSNDSVHFDADSDAIAGRHDLDLDMSTIAAPVPLSLYDNNINTIFNNKFGSQNFTQDISTPTITGTNITATTVTTAASVMDLSYIALFCFILGVLCTYLLSKLVSSLTAWYKGRIPRYIARLEKQAIALLSEHRYAEVKALLLQHLPCIEGYKGARHTDVAAFRHFLGKALLALGERSAACRQLSKVVGIYEAYGEDLYMAHALEDLALAQQEEGDRITKAIGAEKNATALCTMQRALRIFTEEALALQALASQPLASVMEDIEIPDGVLSPAGTTNDSSDHCSIHLDDGDIHDSVDSNDSIVYSICTDTTIDALDAHSSPEEVFAIRTTNYGSQEWRGSTMYNEDLSSGEEQDNNSVCSSVSRTSINSLDSQDPQSPIYSPVKRQDKTEKSTKKGGYLANKAVSPTKRRISMVFESAASPVLKSLSPVKVSSKKKKAALKNNIPSAKNDEVENAAARVNKNNNTKKGVTNQGKGGSPNENAHPNNKDNQSIGIPLMTPTSKKSHSAAAVSGKKDKKNQATQQSSIATAKVTISTPAASTNCYKNDNADTESPSAGCNAAEVSFRTALADLERLLAEPATSTSVLLGPYTPHTPRTSYTPSMSGVHSALKTPTTHYTDSVLDYSPCSSSYAYDDLYTSDGDIDSYSAAYAQVNSDLKPTSNPLHAEPNAFCAEDELNALLLHSPTAPMGSKTDCFDSIECVKDPHVARVLHRVATLLSKLSRFHESIAYLTAARCVYVELLGEDAEVIGIIDEEMACRMRLTDL